MLPPVEKKKVRHLPLHQHLNPFYQKVNYSRQCYLMPRIGISSFIIEETDTAQF